MPAIFSTTSFRGCNPGSCSRRPDSPERGSPAKAFPRISSRARLRALKRAGGAPPGAGSRPSSGRRAGRRHSSWCHRRRLQRRVSPYPSIRPGRPPLLSGSHGSFPPCPVTGIRGRRTPGTSVPPRPGARRNHQRHGQQDHFHTGVPSPHRFVSFFHRADDGINLFSLRAFNSV